jgi:hypothetical protein
MLGPSAGERGDDLGMSVFSRHNAQSLGREPARQSFAMVQAS